jgi:hypothetical protein
MLLVSAIASISVRSVLGYQFDRSGIDRDVRQIGTLLVEVFAQGFAHCGFGDEAQADQHFPQRYAATALLDQCDAQLIFADHTFADQQRT